MSLFDANLHATGRHEGLVYSLGITVSGSRGQSDTTTLCLGCLLESLGDCSSLDTRRAFVLRHFCELVEGSPGVLTDMASKHAAKIVSALVGLLASTWDPGVLEASMQATCLMSGAASFMPQAFMEW